MMAYHESFPVSIVKDLFTWGSVTLVSLETPGVHRGKEIIMTRHGGIYGYKVTQKTFIETIDTAKTPAGRSKHPEERTLEEWKEFRSVSGRLQWVASQTRPEVGPIVSLSNKGKETTYKDLDRLYKTIEYLKETADNGLVYSNVLLNKATTFLTYADSSAS